MIFNPLIRELPNSTIAKYWKDKPVFKKRKKVNRNEPVLTNEQIETLKESLDNLLKY